jgi:hypothetical protein
MGGVPAYRQAGRGTIKTTFPLLASLSPLRAREAPRRRPGGASIVYCFWTFEKILSYLDLFEGIAFVKKINKIK